MERRYNRQQKLHIVKGDTVIAIAGNEKGKQGKVLEVIRAKDRVIVEGMNIVSKHVKPSAQNPDGGIQKTEAGIHISNLMIVDPSTGEPTRIGRKKNDKGKLQRFSKKTGEFISNG